MTDLLKGYPVVVETPVAWGEMDAFQHVNNIVYFRYFESARMAYFEKIEFMKMKEEIGIGPILASTNCRFRIPLSYPDHVSIGARISEIQEDRFLMKYAVVSRKHRKLAAEGDGLMVCYDYNTNSKAVIPDELRKRIAALEGERKE